MVAHRSLALVVGLGLVAGSGLNPLATPAVAAPAPEVGHKPAAGSVVFPVDGQPERITAGPDGNVWFVVTSNSANNDLAKITPAGAITYYDLGAVTIGTLVVGPDKNLWATTDAGVAKIPVASPTTFTSYAITGFANPQGLAVGPDENLWAAGGDTLWRVPPAAPTTATAVNISGSQLKQVTATSDRIWVADANGQVHAVTTAGAVTSTVTGGQPQGIVAGPDGQVFYTVPDGAGTFVGRQELGGPIQKTAFPNTDPSFGVAFGPDDNYWFGLLVSRDALAVSPTGKVTEAGTFPAPYGARYVATGPQATMWMSLQNPGSDGAIGRVTGLDVDKTATIKVQGGTAKLAKGKAAVKLQCPKAESNGPCTGKVTLRTVAGKKLGTKTYSVRAGRTGTVKVALSGGAVGQKVLAVVKVKDALGNKTTVKKKIRLVR